MKIAVVGLGHIGAVTAACLARDGHDVVGIDSDPEKIQRLRDGAPVTSEENVNVLLRAAFSSGKLSPSKNLAQGVARSDLTMVCVGAPGRGDGSIDASPVVRACEDVGGALRGGDDPHTVVVRSALPPGAFAAQIAPTLEHWSDRSLGDRFAAVYNPAFFNECAGIADYDAPPRILIGAENAAAGETVAALYRAIDAPLILTEINAAETIKYADNAWRSVKIAFANELGALTAAIGVDTGVFYDAVEKDCPKQGRGLSAAFSEAGIHAGVSNAAKELRALVHRAGGLEIETPLLSAALLSADHQIDRTLALVRAARAKTVAILGIGLQADAEDVRENPQIRLLEHLIGQGYGVCVHDMQSRLARLTGANRRYIDKSIPHLLQLVSDDLSESLEDADTIILGDADPYYYDAVTRLSDEKTVIDLVGAARAITTPAKYHGVSW